MNVVQFFSLTPCSIPLHIKQKIKELILYKKNCEFCIVELRNLKLDFIW